jgi:hypothetical protein
MPKGDWRLIVDRYENDPELKKLAESLKDVVVKGAKVVEDEHSSQCVVRLWLGDGRIVEIGVSGNLYDEAYFVFDKVER